MSLQVVIDLCKRKETAALKIKATASLHVKICLLCDGFFLLPSSGSFKINISCFLAFTLLQ
ncbi:hypothetical protein DW760_15265 [Coprobacillus sp. AM29-13]|nr:hypothetical protein DWX48_15110 [Coprobacillus sp. AF19-3]RHT48494.1 hypothetical protein DW760_15265 [Coprobacillus sp. AM29-13]